MADPAHTLFFVNPGRRCQIAGTGTEFGDVRARAALDSGFTAARRSGTTRLDTIPSAGGGPARTGGAGGARSSKRQP